MWPEVLASTTWAALPDGPGDARAKAKRGRRPGHTGMTKIYGKTKILKRIAAKGQLLLIPLRK